MEVNRRLSAQGAAPKVHTRERDAGLERTTETKASTKTREFHVYLAAAVAILIASVVVDGFNATEGWMSMALAVLLASGIAYAI